MSLSRSYTFRTASEFPGLSEQGQEIILYLECTGEWHLLLASVVVMMTRCMHSSKGNGTKVSEEYLWDFEILFEMSASDFNDCGMPEVLNILIFYNTLCALCTSHHAHASCQQGVMM